MEFILITIGTIAAVISAYLCFLTRRDIAPCIGKVRVFDHGDYLVMSAEIIAAKTECRVKSVRVKGMVVAPQDTTINGAPFGSGQLHLVRAPDLSKFSESLPLDLEYDRFSSGSTEVVFVCVPASSSNAQIRRCSLKITLSSDRCFNSTKIITIDKTKIAKD